MSKHKHRVTPAADDDFEVLDAPKEVEDRAQYATIPEAPPSEVEKPKEDVEDPYAVLQRNFAAVNKAKDEAEERARAAEHQRDELDGRVAKQASSEFEIHKALVQKEYTLAENEGVTAEKAYADAMAAGDYAAAAKAQRAIVRVENKLAQLETLYTNIEEQAKNPPKVETKAPPVPQDAFEEGLRNLPKPLQDWAREHEADLRERTPLALAAGELAVKKGLKPGSDAYLDFMDEQLGYFEEDDGEEVEVAPPPVAKGPPPKRRTPPIAAPVSRTPASDPSKVYLTEFDKQVARELGMTDRDYAKFKRDAPNSNIAQKFQMQTTSRRGGR